MTKNSCTGYHTLSYYIELNLPAEAFIYYDIKKQQNFTISEVSNEICSLTSFIYCVSHEVLI